ncbi:MAG: SpoIIE family protein phosphatase [Gammaproteobacteria bacterium]
MAVLKPRSAECASASLTVAGQTVCGDKYFVADIPEGMLVAVVDGIGHGEEAAEVATQALAMVEQYKSETLPELASRCDEALRGTRGVAMALAAFNAEDHSVTWLGIGNVAGRIQRRVPSPQHPHETLLQRPGLIGDQRLPRLQTASVNINRGDVLVLATDGVDPGFVKSIDTGEQVEQIAETLLATHSTQSDDALVFVIRYLG